MIPPHDTALPFTFWSKVREQGDCWIWVGAVGDHGYGSFGIGNKQTALTHRLSYEDAVGPIPDGMQLDHLPHCRVRQCCKPEHLEPVTATENKRRGRALVTHCPQGHEYTDENTIVKAGGHRHCRTCQRQWKREWERRNAAKRKVYNAERYARAKSGAAS